MWGTWSQVTYLNQRHFASAIGILLLVLVFLVIRYRAVAAKRAEARGATDATIAQPNESPDTGSMSVTVNPGGPEDARTPQAGMPSVAVATEPRQGDPR